MKLLTFSFDDNEIHDKRLTALLRQYGIKATFFLISNQWGMRVPFHRYGEDLVVERMAAADVQGTYRGMEVASHTRIHRITDENALDEMTASMAELSALCGYSMEGMAYPGGFYTPAQKDAIKKAGLLYARGASPTHSFAFPEDWYAWQPTCRYIDALPLVPAFLNGKEDMLFHIYGHSYELTQPDASNNWQGFESLLQQLAGRNDVLYCTNAEARRYIMER